MVGPVQARGEMMTSDSRPTLIPEPDADDDLSVTVCPRVNDFQNVFIFLSYK